MGDPPAFGPTERPTAHAGTDTGLLDHDPFRLVVLDEHSDGLVELNSSASEVWLRLDGTSTVGDLARDIAERFGIDPATAADGVDHALAEFWRNGLIDGSPRWDRNAPGTARPLPREPDP